MVWGSGSEVQKKSLALGRKRFAPVRTGLAPVRETFSALPNRSPKPPLALSPDHFGENWAIRLLSVPTAVVKQAVSETTIAHKRYTDRKFHQGAPKGRQQKGETGPGTHIFADFCRFSLIIGSLCKSRDLGVADLRRNRRKPQIFAGNRRKPQIFAETGFSHLLSPFWRAPRKIALCYKFL